MKILIGMLVSYFGFEIYENVSFLGFAKLASFIGIEKIAIIFGFIENLRHFLGYKLCIWKIIISIN